MTLPGPFIEKMRSLLGEEADDFFSALTEKPKISGLRVNTLKIQLDTLSNQLGIIPLVPIPWCPSGLYYPSDTKERPSKSPLYKAGLYYLQEPSAMAPVEILAPEPGDRVLDLCAAPGGKAAQIAGHLQGGGLLVANDSSASRSRALVKNLTLCGVRNAIILNEAPKRLISRFGEFFDKILVDAPCSGEGMFRKDPDAVRAWTANKPGACIILQREILHYAAGMLKPGGYMVYSTCTFNTMENEEMIAHFIKSHSNFETAAIDHKAYGFSGGFPPVEEAARLWPHKLDGEGHFICKLRKKPDVNEPVQKANRIPKLKSASGTQRTIKVQLRGTERSQAIYAVPEAMPPGDVPDLTGLRIARFGWYLGDEKTGCSGAAGKSGAARKSGAKSRFEPSHEYALGLKRDEWETVYDLSPDECERYLRGESFEAELPFENKSWVLVCVSGYPLGWARWVNGQLKNKYPQGWIT